jgi:hypothetical protein
MVEDACDELSHSSRLRTLLGIVLQFGNRLNTAGANSKRKAGAFTLDSLLKLNQAKAFDKKTTFLHYVVLIVQRNNELLLNFSDDLPTVLKADKVFWDQCLSDLEEVENQLENVRRISLHEARMKQQYRLQQKQADDDSLGDIEMTLEEEVEALRATPTGLFTLGAIKQVSALRDKVELTRRKFLKALEYFGEDEKKMQPHELFNIFTTFCRDFNKAKEEVFANAKKRLREERKQASKTSNGKNGKPPTRPDRTSMPLRASSHQPNMSRVIRDFQAPQKPQNGVSTPRSSNKIVESQNVAREISKNLSPSNQNHLKPSSPRGLNVAAPHNHVNSRPAHSPKNNVYSRPEISEDVPRGMQESGRFEEMSVPSPDRPLPAPSSVPSSREAQATEALRQKARARRSKQVQIVSGRTTPVTSNIQLSKEPIETRAPEYESAGSSPRQSMNPPARIEESLRAPPRKVSPRHTMRNRRRLVEARKRPSQTSGSSPTNGGMDWPVSSDVAAS